MDADQGGQGLRLVQGARRARWSSGRPAARSPRIRRRPGTCPVSRTPSRADAPHPRARLAFGVVGVRRARAGRQEDAGSKMGLTSLLEMMWADEFVDERDARFINDRVHANIQRDGTFSVVPQMKGGVTNVAPAAPHRRRRGQVRDPDDQAAPAGSASTCSACARRTCRRCGRTSTCRRGTRTARASGPSRRASAATSAASASATRPRWASRSRSATRAWRAPPSSSWPSPAAPATAPRPTCKDLGVVAVDGGRWEIYVGGAAGAHIRKGDLLATVDDPATVITLTGRFMQYYRESANWLERTYAWVPRVGHRAPPGGGRGRTRRRRVAAVWTSACRSRSTPTAIRGRTAGNPRRSASSGRRCRCFRSPRCQCDERLREEPRVPMSACAKSRGSR